MLSNEQIENTNWKDIKMCMDCEVVNAERIPYNWIVKTVESKDCECCKCE